MRVAVIGAGIFGVTISVRLARARIKVDLFEKNSDILMAASGINQFRLHRGYHYPRSPETVRECLEAEECFRREYGGAVIDSNDHFYCIANEGSFVSPDDYINFCLQNGLEFKEESCPFINKVKVGRSVKVKESLINLHSLRSLCKTSLHLSGVNLVINKKVTPELVANYDFVVTAAYAELNYLTDGLTGKKQLLQFEICEKPLIRMPPEFRRASIVIMDGPFMCMDPAGLNREHLLGNVTHAIHESNIGYAPVISDIFRPLLNRGVLKDPPVSKFKEFIRSGVEFIPRLREAQYLGSMFTIRTVLPDVEKTDARPTIVNRINDKVISVFSGKIGTCVVAAEEVLGILKSG